MAAQPRAGSRAALAEASEGVDTLKLCLHARWDSMRHQVLVVLVVDFGVVSVEEASVEEASAVIVVIAVTALDLVVELATKEDVMDLEDSHLQMLLLVQAVDVVVDLAVGVEADSTVVPPVATESLSGPEIATLTVTVVTATVTATETVIASQTATEIATETGTVIVSVTGMVAERIMDGSDTVRMMNATTRDLGGDTIKYSISLISHGSYSLSFLSPNILVGIPDFYAVRPFLRNIKGVRRELNQ